MLEQIGVIAVEAEFDSFRLVDVSLAAEHVLGYSVAECCSPGFLLEVLIHPDDAEAVVARIMSVFDGGRVELGFRAVRKDGQLIELQAILAGFGEADRPRFGGILFKGRGRSLSAGKSEDRLQLALDSADMGVWDWNLSEWTIFWSDQVYRLHGSTQEELGDLFENYQKLVERVHPDDLPSVEEIIMRALRTGADYDIEYRVRLSDGTLRWLNVKGRIYFDENDEPERIAGTVQDCTARKTAEIAAQRELAERRRAEAELKQLNETLEERVRERTLKLERANKQLENEVAERTHAEKKLSRANRELLHINRELRDFAHVASHDLREPLRKITTLADLLQKDHGNELDSDGGFLLERMRYSAHRMMQLIDDLLRFSRVKTGGRSFAKVDLNGVVDDVLADLEVRIDEEDASIHVGELPTIEADQTQMRQLFQNLVSNALKFRQEDVAPVIEISAVMMDGNHAATGRMCRLMVKDNGIGFDEKYSERVFVPFQRLRQEYEGTGMGLAICRRIAERHHGTISVGSIPEEGTTITIDLPLRQPVAEDSVADFPEDAS